MKADVSKFWVTSGGASCIITLMPAKGLKSQPILTPLRIKQFQGFPGGAVVRNLPANAGDTGSSPGPGGSHMPRSN